MKECRCCKINKVEDHFPKRPSNSDGLYSYCKKCVSEKQKNKPQEQKESQREKNREYAKKNRISLNEKSKEYYYKNRDLVLKKSEKYREKNKEKISVRQALARISDKDRFEKNRERHLSWSENNRERINQYQREWYQKNKEKRWAHVVLNRAVKSGKILRPKNCSECKKECKPDGHHLDYNRPLDVIWICRACHSRKSPRTVLNELPVGCNHLCKENNKVSI